ncbi:Dyp-type peroxidase [Streptomyces sp. PR69]|uniref:Dyp-type peroxidase n=1 Tax=Streptomyces sp. PR69 TaxID=2984950 RepID=UPI00226484C6|nr:Dyp-type peroxidase [Streptomyces sp. PR69]
MTDSRHESAADDGVGAGRRRFMIGAAQLAGAAAACQALGPAAVAHADEPPPARPTGKAPGGADKDGGEDAETAPAIEFHGAHQAGILTPHPPFATFAAFDVNVETRRELAHLFKTMTDRNRALTRGLTAGDPEVAALPDPQDDLTVTVGVGASLFDDRFGLRAHKPARLGQMPSFAGDALDPATSHGDLSIQVCARYPDAVLHVIRDLTRETHGALTPRWRMDGFLNPPRPMVGAPRSFLGFKDGIAQPDLSSAHQQNRMLWVGEGMGEPRWALGGSYQVLRIVRFRAEAWDRVPTGLQERIMGRRKGNGAPLGMQRETDLPDYTKDPLGLTIPLDSHIRRANPRTAQTQSSLMLRRSYNYDNGMAPDGTLDIGLVFCCYQQDLVRQFEAVQKRLEGEQLADFTTTTGGGYFFALPGVRNGSDWYGSQLLGRDEPAD